MGVRVLLLLLLQLLQPSMSECVCSVYSSTTYARSIPLVLYLYKSYVVGGWYRWWDQPAHAPTEPRPHSSVWECGYCSCYGRYILSKGKRNSTHRASRQSTHNKSPETSANITTTTTSNKLLQLRWWWCVCCFDCLLCRLGPCTRHYMR